MWSTDTDLDLKSIPNGLTGYESVVAHTFFPMKFHPISGEGRFSSKSISCPIGPAVMSRLSSKGMYQARLGLDDLRETGDSVVLSLLETGNVYFQGRQKVSTGPGDLILMNSSDRFEATKLNTTSVFAIRFPAKLFATRYGNVEEMCLQRVSTTEGAAAILREAMFCYWRQRAYISPQIAGNLINSLFQLIEATFCRSGTAPKLESLSAQNHFLRIRDVVIKHLSDSNLSADFVSEQLSISKSHLYSITKKANTTIRDLILEIRLDQAKNLLEFPTHRKRSISDIAFSVGFSEHSYFTRCFVKRYGKTPKAFRADVFQQ